MLKTKCFILVIFSIITCTACYSKFNWRTVNFNEAPISILFPAKPTEHTKEINLKGTKLNFHMMATKINKINFAAGYVKVNKLDSNFLNILEQQQYLLDTMKLGMINNIRGNWLDQKYPRIPRNTIIAKGQLLDGAPVNLIARFLIHDTYLIQVIIMGNEKSLDPEIAEMFFDSLKLK